MKKIIENKLLALRRKNDALWREFKEIDMRDFDLDSSVRIIDLIEETEIKIEILEEVLDEYDKTIQGK